MGLLGYALSGAAGGAGAAAQTAMLEQQKAQLEEQKIDYALQAQENMKDIERGKIAAVVQGAGAVSGPTDDPAAGDEPAMAGMSTPASAPTSAARIDSLLNAGYTPEAGATAQALKVSSYPDLFMQNLANKTEIENTKAGAQIQASQVRGADAAQVRAAATRDAANSRAGAAGQPSLAQKAKAIEIDLARQKIQGLSPEDIKARTQQFTNTGRENPNYDPQLAGQARLAFQRKVGDDPWFDNMLGGGVDISSLTGENGPRSNGQILKDFANDPAMSGKKLGQRTAQGTEVFDSSGKLVGYYR